MNVQVTRLYKDLLFLHGHVADPRLGADLATDQAAPQPGTASEESPMNLFKSLWLLGGLQSIDPRIGEDEETGFGATYGNRVASARVFGQAREVRAQRAGETRVRKPIAAHDTRVAHC